MAKLIDGTVKLTGVKTSADRTVCKETVTYRPHGRCWDGEDVNAIVYDLMIIACYDMMTVGDVLYGGDYTAAEMAGTLCGLHQYVEGDYKTIRIETKTFCCTYHTGEAFYQMVDWESATNMAPKNYHRFHCEGKELPKDVKILPLIRRSYKPKTISLAAENTRIAKKFEVLGAMSEDLGSEGMKRALSVLTAIKSIEKLHGHDMGDMAGRMLRRKLWRDYGKRERLHLREAWLTDEMKRTDQGSDRYKSMKKDLDEVRKKLSTPVSPVCYSARDFEHGPEVWKQVDEAYVKELIAYFRQVLADSPVPEWPKQGDMVQLKNQAKQCKKWQGKLSVWKVYGSLNEYQDRIEWLADICTTKGKHDSMTRGVESLEPWTEPEKPKVKAKKTAKKGADNSKKRAKVAASQQKSVASQQLAEASNEVAAASNEVSLAERLRQALLKQMHQAV